MSPVPLSKSKLLSCLQCEKKLWLELYRPELAEVSASREMTLTFGHEVGTVARTLYDTYSRGIETDPGLLGVFQAVALTTELLGERRPIFEAGFSANGTTAFADLLLPVDETPDAAWRMVEVKASASLKDYHRDDAAVQAYVALNSGLPLESIAVAHVDSKWVYPGGGDYRGLLKEEDLTEEAFDRREEVESWIADAQDVASRQDEPFKATGDHCSKPYDCGFLGYCRSRQARPEHPAEWFPHKGKNLKKLIFEDGCLEMSEVPDESLNSQQLRVKRHTLANTVYFDAVGSARDLAPHGFPSFFLDFETIAFAVPVWPGTRPYQQIPFQFSLHRLGSDRQLEERSFLDVSGDDPSRALALSLIEACEENGPVFAYNAPFERGVIEGLASRLPDLRPSLTRIMERLVDLLPIARNRYYHPAMQGSWSIKNVLPTIAHDLDYGTLEGVQDGGMAQFAFKEAIRSDTSTSRRTELRKQLVDYCRLDTYSMVRLWQHFSGRSGWQL